MASRRSRLQIKPNIGGVKPAAPKPQSSPKTAKPEPQSEVPDGVNADTDTEKKIEAAPDVTKDENCFSKQVNTEPENAEKVVDKKSEEKDAPADKKTETATTVRARLKRFGTVNIAVARDNASDRRSAEKVVDKQQEDKLDATKPSLSITEDPVPSSSAKHKDENVLETPKVDEKITVSSSADSTAKTARRSKFPKAKPNLGVKRQRDTEQKQTLEASPKVEKTSVKLPEIIITEPEAGTSVVERTPTEVPAGEEQKPSRPLAVPKSPLKAPTPNILLASPVKDSAEKRGTATGSTEKIRRVKVEAPVDKPPDRTSMRMRDLIHWNPSSNPMNPKNKTTIVGREKENILGVGRAESDEEEAEPMEDTPLPVPQVTVGPDGNIIINEISLVVKDPDLNKGPTHDSNIIDETDSTATYKSFLKRPHTRSKPWSKKDTVKFYKALAMIGIDFFLITQLFPKRTRDEIKKKFRKEEKMNRPLIEKVLRERIKFDPALFEKQLEPESEDEEEPAKKKLKKAPRQRKPRQQNKHTETANKGKTNKKKGQNKRRDYFKETSEEEDEGDDLPHNPAGKDATWMPPRSVSGEAGEVVNILMDMREGRLSTDAAEASSQENRMRLPLNVMNGPQFIATPIPNISTTSTANVYSQNYTNSGDAIGNADNYVQYGETVNINFSNASEGYSQDLQQMAENATSNDFLSNVGNNMGMANATFGIPQTIDGDQYVLVTVVPEGGGETVIHIYRVHGGLLEGEQGGTGPQLNAQQLADGETSLSDLSYDLTASLPILQSGENVETVNIDSVPKEFMTLQSATHILASSSDTLLDSSTAVQDVVTIAEPWKYENVNSNVASSCEMTTSQQGLVVSGESATSQTETAKSETEVGIDMARRDFNDDLSTGLACTKAVMSNTNNMEVDFSVSTAEAQVGRDLASRDLNDDLETTEAVMSNTNNMEADISVSAAEVQVGSDHCVDLNNCSETTVAFTSNTSNVEPNVIVITAEVLNSET